ncbi:hypothetical protein H920_18152 [Fukomys damarensis]|uniref:Ferritin n=1 Tax=Fukomys damarensis TaxID=885580 RepID=A0A091CQP4_FUKDA|nr:hypothetical protein H920_18152 [Fukomys damarensis]
MEYDEDLGPISEECTTTIKHVISYQLSIGDVYSPMACSYAEEKEMPNFAIFFEDQAEVRRYHVKWFLKYLRNCKIIICLPVFQVPYLDKLENDEQVLQSSLKAEIDLTKILEDLQTAASQAIEIKFVQRYLIKQKRNSTYLECEITYQKQLEELREQHMREQQEQQIEEEQGPEQEVKETKEHGLEQERKERKERGQRRR